MPLSERDPQLEPDRLPEPIAVLAPVRFAFEPVVRSGYCMRLARNADDLERVQRLRFEVFNVELREGFASSWETGRDQDDYDPHVHHLMVEHSESGQVVGTYRLQTRAMADAGAGLMRKSM